MVVFALERMRKRHVLLLDGDQWRFSGVATYLRDRGLEVCGPGFGAESPDVILVHEALRDALPSLLASNPRVPVLVLGFSRSLDCAAEVLRSGALGYFVLTSRKDQLLEAIEIVMNDRIWAPREAVVRSVSVPATVSRPQPPDAVLELLQEGLTNKEIAHRLGLAEVTVKARLTRLYRRYGVNTRLQLLTAAIREGIVGQR